jgi:formate/nitrite transporter FocA (FNT family)
MDIPKAGAPGFAIHTKGHAHRECEMGESAPKTGTRLSAREIYHNVRESAEEEMERPAAGLFWSAITAGLTIGFSFFAAAYLSSLAPEPFRAAAAAVGYPLGFVFVVLGRSQLFTENTLEPIIPFLNHPTRPLLQQLLILWCVVLAGNLIGAAGFAAMAALTPMANPEFQRTLADFAAHATSDGFGMTLYRGLFAGWLIALMAWLVASTIHSFTQVVLIWLTTAPISVFEFRHSVVGSIEALYRLAAGTAGWVEMTAGFILPAVLGNIIGGFVFVALLNHGQVMAEWPANRARTGSSEHS